MQLKINVVFVFTLRMSNSDVYVGIRALPKGARWHFKAMGLETSLLSMRNP